jgi:hypothetical protein
MNRFSFLLLFSLLSFSCGKKDAGVEVYPVKQQYFAKHINDQPLPERPNLSLEKSFVNLEYPIEIALYSDQRFYYDLPNLGSGSGTWKYEEGKIKLYAKRTLFNMEIDVYGADDKASELAITFSDRFGPNKLKMVTQRLEN